MHTISGKVYQPARKWYTMRETLEIYAKGGVINLQVGKKPDPATKADEAAPK